jgi:multicomponent Na+:H+ antiporter subunit D
MSPGAILTSCVVVPLIAGVVTLALMKFRPAAMAVSIIASVLQVLLAALLIFTVDREGHVVIQAGGWPAPFGISLVADRLAASMVFIAALTAFFILLHVLANRERNLPMPLFLPLYFLLLLGVQGAFLTGDLFNLYVWFEVMLLASFVLMTIGGTKPQLDGGFKYVILNLFSSAIFLIGVGIIYGKLGTLNMADVAAKLSEAEDPVLINTSSVLLLVAFGVKAGLFPFFFWLPASYHTPAFAVSALFAALLTKVGVYALIRSQLLLMAPYFSGMQGLLFFLAALTMITGVLGAAAQFHTRKILSFHIISQIGYMILGLAIATPLAVAGAIFYIIHNIVAKTNLFLISGIIHRLTGQEDLAKLGGLVRTAPWLALFFLISALGLAGIPPLSGFWAKFFLVKASIDSNLLLMAVIALSVGLLTLFSMIKIWNEAFWKAAPASNETGPKSRQLHASSYIPVASMALIVIILGILVQPVFGYFYRAADQLLDPQQYIQAVLGQDSPSFASTRHAP